MALLLYFLASVLGAGRPKVLVPTQAVTRAYDRTPPSARPHGVFPLRARPPPCRPRATNGVCPVSPADLPVSPADLPRAADRPRVLFIWYCSLWEVSHFWLSNPCISSPWWFLPCLGDFAKALPGHAAPTFYLFAYVPFQLLHRLCVFQLNSVIYLNIFAYRVRHRAEIIYFIPF